MAQEHPPRVLFIRKTNTFVLTCYDESGKLEGVYTFEIGKFSVQKHRRDGAVLEIQFYGHTTILRFSDQRLADSVFEFICDEMGKVIGEMTTTEMK